MSQPNNRDAKKAVKSVYIIKSTNKQHRVILENTHTKTPKLILLTADPLSPIKRDIDRYLPLSEVPPPPLYKSCNGRLNYRSHHEGYAFLLAPQLGQASMVSGIRVWQYSQGISLILGA
jgi:hypothetical protein